MANELSPGLGVFVACVQASAKFTETFDQLSETVSCFLISVIHTAPPNSWPLFPEQSVSVAFVDEKIEQRLGLGDFDGLRCFW